ncbi:lactate dehydrogenase [Clostridium sp. P21]|uniref:Lactate dehydrogenase n=1 Tax=Clostridium muellerianum TaxID=2716538 RepID=A0A7Y0EFX6_9CLOT|nr:lactate dehydrogenase [Clostridium muellerianum]NMM62661.1 lactate dehydrogenase [Clostridium muellerianum]
MNSDLFYYVLNDNLLISNKPYDLNEASENYVLAYEGPIFALNKIDSQEARRSFCVTSLENLFMKEENLNILKKFNSNKSNLPSFLLDAIKERKVISLNTAYDNWKECLNEYFPVMKENKHFKKWSVTVVGLGDVGGTLITGLRLLGADCISQINIYDKDINKVKRWCFECNQILSPDPSIFYPTVISAKEEDLFNCNMFIFCVSVGVPKVGNESSDVRLAQFEGNSKIVSLYAKMAKEKNFKGIFSVVSDPVDLLCKVALNEHLLPEQIRGYGLGVMNARASYYASQNDNCIQYLKEGRAFGPHGEHLVIADSINNYNEEASKYLTEKTIKSNLEVRSLGFKPYIAPALSSGALSIIATIKSEWHYSATFIGGAFMGCRNRLLTSGIELEGYKNMPSKLFDRLEKTYNELLSFKY